MSTCNKCKIVKSLNEFQKDRTRPSGYKNTCKNCVNLRKRSLLKHKNYEPQYELIIKCWNCKENKQGTEFNKNKRSHTGLMNICKMCRVDISYKRYEKNKEKIKKQTNQYYYENKPKVREQRKVYQKNKMSDPFFVLTRRLRNRLYYALKKQSWKKDTHFNEYIGCNLSTLKQHIESQFQVGMTWENRQEWHIDHIIPLSSAKTEDELYKLCHYTNLQPLWAKDNIKKSNS